MSSDDLEQTFRNKVKPAIEAWATEGGGQLDTKKGIKFVSFDGKSQKPGLLLEVSDLIYDLPPDYFDTDTFPYFKPILRYLIPNGSSTTQKTTWSKSTTLSETLSWHFDMSFTYSSTLKLGAKSSFASAEAEQGYSLTVSGGVASAKTTSRTWSVDIPVKVPPGKTILCLHGALGCSAPIPFSCTLTPASGRDVWSAAEATKKNKKGGEESQRNSLQRWMGEADPSVVFNGQVNTNALGSNLITMFLEKPEGGANINPDDPDLSVSKLIKAGWGVLNT